MPIIGLNKDTKIDMSVSKKATTITRVKEHKRNWHKHWMLHKGLKMTMKWKTKTTTRLDMLSMVKEEQDQSHKEHTQMGMEAAHTLGCTSMTDHMSMDFLSKPVVKMSMLNQHSEVDCELIVQLVQNMTQEIVSVLLLGSQ